MLINIVQIHHKNQIYLGKVLIDRGIQISHSPCRLIDLVRESIKTQQALSTLIESQLSEEVLEIETLLNKNAFIFPIQHGNDHSTLVGGSGLTHQNRALMRKGMEAGNNNLSDVQRLFQLGLNEGKLDVEISRARPEWFYKGRIVNARTHGQALEIPSYDLGGGEEAEIVAVYYISEDRQAYRVGFCLGNEFSDHALEKENYYYASQCKLRPFSIGSEIIIGDIPEKIQLDVCIFRKNEPLWQATVNTGEANMLYSYQNIENYILQNSHVRMADIVYFHFMGTSAISYADNVVLQNDDRVRISSLIFALPLENTIKKSPNAGITKAVYLR